MVSCKLRNAELQTDDNLRKHKKFLPDEQIRQAFCIYGGAPSCNYFAD